ncbi:MAG: aminotransferase class I/II-fold pyridoxal phosphate-dependent enzyme [Actinomycetia bacterium]|nr:aminotransferase class I/II-fold pyridoxal phosphate-dependent enzyme [Actinomycetes bacterium]
MGGCVTQPAYDFESISLEWLHSKPGAKWHRTPDAIAAWVADMDFAPAPAITAALTGAIATGDLGYPDWRSIVGESGATDAFVDRCERRYGWQINASDTREFNDVVQAIQLVLHTCTSPGDGVVVHSPTYPPFLNSIETTGCRLVPIPAQRTESSPTGWAFDYDALESTLRGQPARVLLLCHPQNPTGHVFSDDELRALAALAERHDLLIISDEIHADLTYSPHVHRPMALFAPDRTVSIHAASKAFNLAGMRYAIAHFGSQVARKAANALPEHLLGATNLMGAVAVEAAWRDGDEWLAAVLAHLDRQRLLLAELLAEHLPQVKYVPPAATYLAWLDCRALPYGDDPSIKFLERGVRLSEGPNFGSEGIGFARLNFATSSTVLREIVARMRPLAA